MKQRFRRSRDDFLRPLVDAQELTLLAVGGHESRHARVGPPRSLADAEFRIWSQFGEDGIIQYLIGKVPISDMSFVEFGVGDYRESNTRFLLEHDNWKGLILDLGTSHGAFLERSGLKWRHDIAARTAFVTADNINRLLEGNGFVGDIGLMSIDIDGMDYWVLSALTAARPRILIVEYNSIFGADRTLTVPYSPQFSLRAGHWSGLYYGCSLSALVQLTAAHGYAFVGCTTAGNDAFFVRDDVCGDLPRLSAKEGWVESRFQYSRDSMGKPSMAGPHRDRLRVIRECRLLDLETKTVDTVENLFALPDH